MNDPPLTMLIEQPAPQHRYGPRLEERPARRVAAIAREYTGLRAQQTALVLLAERERLDEQSGTLAAPRPNTAARRRLAATHAAQNRLRADIAARRDQLARLIDAPPGSLDNMPGGAIPLPPAQPAGATGVGLPGHRARIAWARYGRAYRAAAAAQARVVDANAKAAILAIRARAGTTPPGDAIAAERRALTVLQAEEQARAAMTKAYIALAQALGSGLKPG